ncbi:MAG: prephenate dehydratase [Chloroflexi bacterium RBG_16_64_32]|nr:MAG: prephenate dehydratase [Chloroflexi bacterium RBG_16_64_32]
MSRRLAFLGPRGTFSEEAALRYDPDGQLVPFVSISAVAAAIGSGMADEGVVPIENSLEGPVTETLDILIHSSELSVRSEVVLPIEHLLLARAGAKASDIKIIASMPQALAQCRQFIEQRFPKATLEAALSTAAAVEEMMGRDNAAAIGNRRAAELYGAEVLAQGIQDRTTNLTRFVILADEDHPPTGDDKTSLAFAFAVEDRPGLLVAALEEFSSRDINLSKIESRPSKERLGVYIFLADLDGHRTEQPLAESLERVREKSSFFRVLGSYPRYREQR